MVLRLEHVEDMRPVGLGGLHHIGAGRIGLAPDAERPGRAVDIHPGLDQGVHKGRGRRHVRLVGRNDVAARIAILRLLQQGVEFRIDGPGAAVAGFCGRICAFRTGRGGGFVQAVDLAGGDRPAVLGAPLDAVGAHLVDVEQQAFAVARGVVDDRPVHAPLIFDRLGQAPGLGRDGHRPVAIGQLQIRNQLHRLRRRAADDLGQQADGVVEIGDRPDHAVVPGGIGGRAAGAGAGLVLDHQAAVHGHAHLLQGGHDQGVIVEIEGVAERRHEHHHAGGAGLVLVEDDLREPLVEQLPVDVGRLSHLRHVAVAIVVVADVLLVEARNALELTLQRIVVAHVPVRHQFHAVRIVVGEQDYDIVQRPQGLGVVHGQQAVEDLDLALAGHRFGGVQARIDPHHGLALGRQGGGVGLVQTLGLGQPPRNRLVMVKLGEVGGG